MNLFSLYVHGLGVCSALVLADFYEHVIFDTIRHRGESWQLAHGNRFTLPRCLESPVS